MQTKRNFRQVLQLAAIAVAFVAMASCTTTKKYGCPNHMFVPPVVSQ